MTDTTVSNFLALGIDAESELAQLPAGAFPHTRATPPRGPMTDLLRVRDLHVEFRVAEGVIRAVRGVSFRVRPGSTVALVGESGSGKSVVRQAIMGILPRDGQDHAGEILFADPRSAGNAIDIAKLDRGQRRDARRSAAAASRSSSRSR